MGELAAGGPPRTSARSGPVLAAKHHTSLQTLSMCFLRLPVTGSRWPLECVVTCLLIPFALWRCRGQTNGQEAWTAQWPSSPSSGLALALLLHPSRRGQCHSIPMSLLPHVCDTGLTVPLCWFCSWLKGQFCGWNPCLRVLGFGGPGVLLQSPGRERQDSVSSG